MISIYLSCTLDRLQSPLHHVHLSFPLYLSYLHCLNIEDRSYGSVQRLSDCRLTCLSGHQGNTIAPMSTSSAPSLPSWLRHPFRGPNQQSGIFPDPSESRVSFFANAVYYPNYRIYRQQPPSSLSLGHISHVFYAFAWSVSSNVQHDDQTLIASTGSGLTETYT